MGADMVQQVSPVVFRPWDAVPQPRPQHLIDECVKQEGEVHPVQPGDFGEAAVIWRIHEEQQREEALVKSEFNTQAPRSAEEESFEQLCARGLAYARFAFSGQRSTYEAAWNPSPVEPWRLDVQAAVDARAAEVSWARVPIAPAEPRAIHASRANFNNISEKPMGPAILTPIGSFGEPSAFSEVSSKKKEESATSRQKKHGCHICGHMFYNKCQLEGHIRGRHTGERPFKCGFSNCTRAFARNEELTRHIRIHTKEKPYPCKLCSKAFGRKDHLDKHQLTHQRRAERQKRPAALIANPKVGTKPLQPSTLTPNYSAHLQWHGCL